MGLKIHQLWMGEKPEIIDECMKSVRDRNQDCIYLEWHEKNLPAMEHHAIIDQCETWREKSDIIRLELIRAYGGVWIDADMLCLKSLSPLWDVSNGSFSVMAETAMIDTRELNVISAFFGAQKGERWINKCSDLIPQLHSTIGYLHDDCVYQCAHDIATREHQKWGRTLYPETVAQWREDNGAGAYLIHMGDNRSPDMLRKVRHARKTGTWDPNA